MQVEGDAVLGRIEAVVVARVTQVVIVVVGVDADAGNGFKGYQ